METSRLMTGLTYVSLKRHKSLVPLLVAIGGGCLLAGAYVLRLATRCPDVSWDKTKNPYPWDAYANKQYKFYAETIDYKNLPPSERPTF